MRTHDGCPLSIGLADGYPKRIPARLLGACLALVAVAGISAGQTPAPAPSAGAVILDGSGVWRVLHSWALPTGATEKAFAELAVGDTINFETQYPPDGWTKTDFDDSVWARQQFFHKYVNGEMDGRTGSGSPSPYLRQLSLRGKFTVADPSKVADLALDVAYRGGIIVHVNGQEIDRQFLPAGQLAPGTPAELYPKKAYVKEDGKPWVWHSDGETIAKEGIYESRVRHVERLAIPASALVKGVNVLAVEIHAAKYPPEYFGLKGRVPWSTCGLVSVQLRAGSDAGIVPNAARPPGVQVWNCNLAAEVDENSWADPHEGLQPIRIVAVKNGHFSGKVAVTSGEPIRGLKAEITELSRGGGGKLPAGSVRVRYGRLWSAAGAPPRDDALCDAPFPEAPVQKSTLRIRSDSRAADGLPPLSGGAVQSVYVSVRVPKEIADGEYTGTLTISFDESNPTPPLPRGADDSPRRKAGVEGPVKVPVQVKVIDWTLPDPADFTYWYGLIQSPDGVGLYYQVEMWSDKHFELIGKSFGLIRQVGGKVLFVNLMAQTEYGNEETMVVWVKKPGVQDGDWSPGNYSYDLIRVRKYINTAVKHMGTPTFVVLGVWQPCERKTGPMVSVKDPETGKITNVRGPDHGTPESLAFWRGVLTEVQNVLIDAGLEDKFSVLLGYMSDAVPDLKTAKVFWDILPKAGWQAARHPPSGVDHIMCAGGEKVAVRYTSNVWGSGDNKDPSVERVYGWNHTYAIRRGLRTWLDRTTYDRATFARFRCVAEQPLLAGRPGLGQVGADFWPPPPEKEGAYRLRTLYSRYPHSANVGSGNRGCTTNQLLYPDSAGAAPTVRFELVRENIQEIEARIALEKLLILKQMCPLSPELMEKAQNVLDERTRWHRLNFNFHGWPDAGVSWPYSSWEKRTEDLYRAAGEVAKFMKGKKMP